MTDQEREDLAQMTYMHMWTKNRAERDHKIEQIRKLIKGESLRMKIAGWIAIVQLKWEYRKIIVQDTEECEYCRHHTNGQCSATGSRIVMTPEGENYKVTYCSKYEERRRDDPDHR